MNELRTNPDPDLVKKLDLKPGEDIVEKMSRNMGTAFRKLQKWTQAGKFTREEMDMAKSSQIIVSVMQGYQEQM